MLSKMFINYCYKNKKQVVLVFSLLLLLSGLLSTMVPKSLLPTVETPTIVIESAWPNAIPKEIETQITTEQEKVIRAIPGVGTIETYITNGLAETFVYVLPGYQKNKVLQDISNRVSAINTYPNDAAPQVISLDQTGNGKLNSAVASSLVVKALDNKKLNTYARVKSIEEQIIPKLRKISGVEKVYLSNLKRPQLILRFEPQKMAQLNVALSTLKSKLATFGKVAGGQGQLSDNYISLLSSKTINSETIANLVIKKVGDLEIKFSDIGYIEYSRKTSQVFTYHNGTPVLMIVVEKSPSGNVIEIQKSLDKQLLLLNKQLKDRDFALTIEKSLDTSKFVTNALNGVLLSLAIGGLLAGLVLFSFFRTYLSTFIVFLTIPISLSIASSALLLSGGTLNLLSIAGLVLLTGLVVDATIVVYSTLESTHKDENSTVKSQDIVKRLNKSLFLSTFTSVVCFVPILFINEIESSLFYDLAIVLVTGLSVSYLISISLTPVLIQVLSKRRQYKGILKQHQVERYVSKLEALRLPCSVAFVVLLGSFLALWQPDFSYLPKVNYDQVISVIRLDNKTYHHTDEQHSTQINSFLNDHSSELGIESYLIFVRNDKLVVISRPISGMDKYHYKDALNRKLKEFYAPKKVFSYVRPVFSNYGLDSSIRLNIFSNTEQSLRAEAGKQFEENILKLNDEFSVDHDPSTSTMMELGLTYNESALAHFDMSHSDINDMLKAYTSGLYVTELFHETENLDVFLRASDWNDMEYFLSLPVLEKGAFNYNIRDISTFGSSTRYDSIKRIDGLPVHTVDIMPPDNMSIESAQKRVEQAAQRTFSQANYRDFSYEISGSAGRVEILQQRFLVSLAIALAFMSFVIFITIKSLQYTLWVLASTIPTLIGGCFGIFLVSEIYFQPLDLLTGIGFLILFGLAVNNGLLLVDAYQSLRDAIQCNKQRVRAALLARFEPVVVTSITTFVGLIPLLLPFGESARVYWGVAYVLSMGMLFNLLTTLFLLPAIIELSHWIRNKVMMETQTSLQSESDF